MVAAALSDAHGRILVQRRPKGASMAGLWEFPGGKVDPGETPELALQREVHEELGISVCLDVMTPMTFASAPLGERHLVMLLYQVREWSGEPRALHADALRWVAPADLTALAMPPADRPLVDYLLRSPIRSA